MIHQNLKMFPVPFMNMLYLRCDFSDRTGSNTLSQKTSADNEVSKSKRWQLLISLWILLVPKADTRRTPHLSFHRMKKKKCRIKTIGNVRWLLTIFPVDTKALGLLPWQELWMAPKTSLSDRNCKGGTMKLLSCGNCTLFWLISMYSTRKTNWRWARLRRY